VKTAAEQLLTANFSPAITPVAEHLFCACAVPAKAESQTAARKSRGHARGAGEHPTGRVVALLRERSQTAG